MDLFLMRGLFSLPFKISSFLIHLLELTSLPCEPKIVKINNFNGKFTSTSNSSLVYVTVLR